MKSVINCFWESTFNFILQKLLANVKTLGFLALESLANTPCDGSIMLSICTVGHVRLSFAIWGDHYTGTVADF
jgi:hypothetical protein